MKHFKLALKTFLVLVIVTSCTGPQSNSKVTRITGAGATFPQPFYNKIFKTYNKLTPLQVTYGGIGSGGGIRSLKDKIVDFGATDAFLDKDKLAKMPAEVLHIPTCLGAVVAAYNIPGKPSLRLSPKVLSYIFMGKITKWNDELIQAENTNIKLPSLDISVIYRSDGSGTTFIFSDYLSKVSDLWKQEIGRGKSLKWPVGIGAKGNPGVAGSISQTIGAIGYIGSEYAFAQNIPVAKIKNFSGNYIMPSVESVSMAGTGDIPVDTRISLTNTKAPQGYPISSFTWIIFYKEQNYRNRSKAQAIESMKLLSWILTDKSQHQTAKVHYAPLPDKAKQRARAIIKTVTYDGETLNLN